MVTIIVRTLFIYLFFVISMRLMGKRQLCQLEVSDFVTTLILSEIAAIPIENSEIPLMFALIPMVSLLFLEVVCAFILSRFPFLKNLFTASPSILIRMGRINTRELRRSCLSVEELMLSLRRAGCPDISEVAYAILEQDGGVTVIPRAAKLPATASDLGLAPLESGIFHIIINDGRIDERNIALLGLSEAWVSRQLISRDLSIDDVFVMLTDDGGRSRVYTKDGNIK